jgi:hypothetical protein
MFSKSSLVLVLGISLFLGGCGGDDDAPASTPTNPTESAEPGPNNPTTPSSTETRVETPDKLFRRYGVSYDHQTGKIRVQASFVKNQNDATAIQLPGNFEIRFGDTALKLAQNTPSPFFYEYQDTFHNPSDRAEKPFVISLFKDGVKAIEDTLTLNRCAVDPILHATHTSPVRVSLSRGARIAVENLGVPFKKDEIAVLLRQPANYFPEPGPVVPAPLPANPVPTDETSLTYFQYVEAGREDLDLETKLFPKFEVYESAALFCDRRTEQKIQPEGTHPGGVILGSYSSKLSIVRISE